MTTLKKTTLGIICLCCEEFLLIFLIINEFKFNLIFIIILA